MPSIQVRDVPEPIYRRLTELAQREHRSLAQQTLAVLARGLGVDMNDKARRKRVLSEIVRADRAVSRHLSDPVPLIRQDRER